MGDQIGVAVSGNLYHVPFEEFERIQTLSATAIERTSLFAALCRINTLYMIARAGSGHIGSSFSSLDILSWLLLNEIRVAPEGDQTAPRDIFFSSKGHDAPALYNVFIGLGRLNYELIHQLRRLGGLPGHPDISTPNIVTNTGSLGMGVSKAKGMIFANRLKKRKGNVFVLTGDGELQEGQFWESLGSAANHKLHELTVIIDHNKLQSDTLVSKVSDLGDLTAKLTAFGWHVSRCDGNDLNALSLTLAASKKASDKPKVIIADTVKGKGVTFMEHTTIDSDVELYKYHSGAPSEEVYAIAIQELIDTANTRLKAIGAASLKLETIASPVAVLQENPQRLILAYSNALLEQARKNTNIVALDADLILDTGLIPFQKEFPDRFIECGIAEQDMVSQAGGMALQGLIPVVHSFTCFLSSRPNEQIYNNATEKTKVIYVGSLAGLLPGGPGHSHQGVRDISALAAVPGLVIMEPSCDAEVDMLFDWCVNQSSQSSYLRLTSLPWVVPYQLPVDYFPQIGRGVTLTQGGSVAIIAYGPLLLSAAVRVAGNFNRDFELSIKVINLPWLNRIDSNWLMCELGQCEKIISLDNHYLIGGQGDRIANILASDSQNGKTLYRVGLNNIPACGTNIEVLEADGLDEERLYNFIYAIIKQ